MDPSGLIFLVLMMVIFYFMLIRPQRRRSQQHRALVESLDVGDDIVTIGGLFGRVEAIGDDDVEVEIAPGTTVRLLKTAVARTVTSTEELDVEADDDIEPAGAVELEPSSEEEGR